MGTRGLTYSAYQVFKRLANGKAFLLRRNRDISKLWTESQKINFNSYYLNYIGFKKRPYALVKPAALLPFRKVPNDIIRPSYVKTAIVKPETELKLKTKEEIECMRQAGQLARKVLDTTAAGVKAGVMTDELDSIAHEVCIQHGAYPSPLLYKGFLKSICTSVNNVMIHGVPDVRPLRDGDIINIDVTVYLNGFHGDVSETYLVGDVDVNGKKLVSATKHCLEAGINACKPGGQLNAVGKAIEREAKKSGFLVSPDVLGHGIGSYFHGPPEVVHVGNDDKLKLEPGMTFTIEPCLVEGKTDFHLMSDGWTVVTKDGGRAAQFEHTVLITDTGVEILTC